jgi:GntR family transcriptional regulator, transcriptional repressor for pyruvate dehydrogenase complex
MASNAVPRQQKRAVMVARQIVHEITARRLEPGSKLPSEADMLADYRVSRNTLREALRLLEVNGLLWIKPGPGGGAVVGSVESENLGHTLSLYLHMQGSTFRELLEARSLLESAVARQAALRRDPGLLERLEEAVKMADAIEVTEDKAWFAASNLFHGVIASGSGNSVLDLQAGALSFIYRERIGGTVVVGKDQRDNVRADHAEIAEAIARGDSERAGELMARHMVEFTAYVEAALPRLLDEVVDWR